MADKKAQSSSGDVASSGISPDKLVGPTEQDLGMDKGYIGPGAPGPADEEFSLQSGPSSPSLAEQSAQVAQAQADTLTAAAAGNDTGAAPAE